MKRAMLLVTVLATALSLLGGTAAAQRHEATGGVQGSVAVKRLKGSAKRPPTQGLVAPFRSKDGQPKPRQGGRSGPSVTTAAEWLHGPSSTTHYYNPILNTTTILTSESVAYWGARDGSYPKVGDLYYGRVVIANVGVTGTPVAAEIVLPPNTVFAIDQNNPDMRVRCFRNNFNTGQSVELTGTQCPSQPIQGIYGAQFVPQAGGWATSSGEAIIVAFPLRTTAELKGMAGSNHCMIGAIWAAASLEVWDAPEPTDRCPLPVDQGRGVFQWVTVPVNSPTIAYPTPSASDVTATTARTTAYLFNHFTAGTACFDIGPTTAYGTSLSAQIPGTADSFTLTADWTGLAPGTTYHWRARFVDGQGRTFVGVDQTFTTAVPADTTPPRVTRVVPAENATGVAPAANVAAFFSEAVRPGTVTTATVRLFKQGSTTPLAATVTYDAAAKKAILNPTANLELGARYRVVVGPGVRDLAGLQLDQNPAQTGNQAKAWTFTVRS